MRRLFTGLFTAAILFSSPAHAVLEDYPSVKLQGLDKSVGRTVTFEAKVGSTIQYGPLFIKIHSCRKAPPIETPESAAFLQIWEVPPGADKSEWVFSGWMFASSPALSAMDHPVYDVWVLDCLGKEEPNAEAQAAETEEQADQSNLAPVDGAVVPEGAAEAMPTDSEAEEPSPAEGATTAPVLPQLDAEIPVDGEAEPLEPEAAAPAIDPSQDEGFTAYDLMRQQQGVPAGNAPVPLTPDAPEQVEELPPEF